MGSYIFLVDRDDFELCEYVSKNPYRFRDLGWRSISNYPFLTGAIYKQLKM